MNRCQAVSACFEEVPIVTIAQSLVHRVRRFSRVGAILSVAAVLTSVPALAAAQRVPDDKKTTVFTVDVAEDFTLFTPTFVRPTDTQPERGAFFVTEGNIFPGGTIQGDGATFNPNGDGAIGRWFCRGTHLVSGAEFPFAARGVHTAQLYLFPDENRSISTEGVEGNGTVVRPVTGGTGPFRGYVGEQKQQLLGFNATGGVNLRVTVTLKRVAH
jgi:hypothetical protein